MNSLYIKKGEKIKNNIINELIYGGHILSIGASCVILTVVFILKLPIQPLLLLIPYLSSQVIYSFNHFRESKLDLISNPERSQYSQGNRSLFLLFFYSLFLIIILLLTNLSTRVFIGFIVFAGILYTEYAKSFTTRYLAGFKNVYTSLFWAISIYLVPLYFARHISSTYNYLILFIFLRFLISTIFFDIKDISDDQKRNIYTIPILFGKKRTLFILHVLNIISISPLIIGYFEKSLPASSLILIFSALYDLYYLWVSKSFNEKSLRLLSYTVVDGETIIWLFLAILSRVFF
jgi:4-hydroxybenzoate polyprenyltransferase